MMRQIVLHGALAERFGDSYTLDVISPAEALRALVTQVKGFREHLRQGHYRIIRGAPRRGNALDIEECKLTLGSAAEMHIVPIVAGASGGLGKILAGVALVALAIFLPATAFAIGSLTIAVNTIVGGIGLSLALGGVAQMMSRAPQLQSGSATADRKDSFLFGGQTNITTQGGAVPIVAGKFEVGSVVISVGLETGQIAPAYVPTLDPAAILRMKQAGQLH